MAQYKGTTQDGQRAAKLTAARIEKDLEFKRKKDEMKSAASTGLRDIDESFNTTQDASEEMFRASAIGLQTAADFARKRKLVKAILHEEEVFWLR
jgi:hypothetical protein